MADPLTTRDRNPTLLARQALDDEAGRRRAFHVEGC
jgi:hypothetical protein